MQNSFHTSTDIASVVLFLTHECPGDVPGEGQLLACLLPLGTASFVERVFDSCALAGVRQIHLVVSEHPESLRHILEDGAPWGIQINWHHAKESVSPYKVLRGMALDPAQRIVIGHAHQWVSSRIVQELLQTNGVALHTEGDMAWTGWFSADFATVAAFGPHVDYESIGAHVRSMGSARCVLASPCEHGQSLRARDLLAAQRHALDGSQEASIPASWRRMPWGACSPNAVIHADANIHGPVLIGAGSVVEAGAEVGPGTVLAHDVFVASGVIIRHSLVMPNTYVGGLITLENVVAQGNSIQSVKWSVRTVLGQNNSVMGSLRSPVNNATPWASRATAALVVATLSPLMPLAIVLQWFGRGHVLWRNIAVVQSSARGQCELKLVQVRFAHSQRAPDRWVAHFGALLDILQGRRCWFGLRPRLEADWYTLSRDWQELFSRTAIGLFHAPAWSENRSESDNNLSSEVGAAADAFMAVQSTMLGRLKIFYFNVWRLAR